MSEKSLPLLNKASQSGKCAKGSHTLARLESDTNEIHGAGVVAEQVKLPTVLASTMGAGSSPDWPLPIQLPLLMLLGNSGGQAKCLGTLQPHGRPRRSSGSQLWSGLALAIVVIWEINQQMEDLSVTPPFK